jgi:hypothetical protein
VNIRDVKTPSGDFCADMAIFPAGQLTDREFRRLQPVESDLAARTEAERLASLRKAACAAGADAVMEAVNEERRNGTLFASGTAVRWVGPKGRPGPLGSDVETKAMAELSDRLFDEGNKLYADHHLEEAEAAYVAAYELKRTFDVAAKLGLVQADLKRWTAAERTLIVATTEFRNVDPALREPLKKRLAEVHREASKER